MQPELAPAFVELFALQLMLVCTCSLLLGSMNLHN